MKISKDGNYIIVPVPLRDLESMARFIAHSVVNEENPFMKLSHEIVSGDLSKQDEFVKKYIQALGIENWVMVLSGPEALELCDELAEKIYEEVPGPVLKKQQEEKKSHLRLVTICVHCHKAKIKGTDCEICGVKK
jgi:hypothetical protein